jgi:hypothetical protein
MTSHRLLFPATKSVVSLPASFKKYLQEKVNKQTNKQKTSHLAWSAVFGSQKYLSASFKDMKSQKKVLKH